MWGMWRNSRVFQCDPTVIRLVWALFSVFTAIFGGIIAYIIACIIIPEEL